MSKRSVLASRLRALFTRGRLERELDEELRFHIEMQTEDTTSRVSDCRSTRDARVDRDASPHQ